jgi:hypothetical protein
MGRDPLTHDPRDPENLGDPVNPLPALVGSHVSLVYYSMQNKADDVCLVQNCRGACCKFEMPACILLRLYRHMSRCIIISCVAFSAITVVNFQLAIEGCCYFTDFAVFLFPRCRRPVS